MSQAKRDAVDHRRSATRALDSVARNRSTFKLPVEHPLVYFPLAALALLIVALAVYYNSFWSGMTLDNKYIIEAYFQTFRGDNPNYDFATWKHVGLIFSQDYWWPKGISGLYRPVATFSYWLNYLAVAGRVDWTKKFPLDPYVFAFHAVNVTLHWIVGTLVCVLARRLTGRPLLSILCGAVFIAHPVTTESVTNIIGRADLFAGAAVVGGLLLYIRSTESAGWRKVFWLLALLLVTLIGLFAKESAAAVGLVVVAYDLVYRFDRKHLTSDSVMPCATATVRLSLLGVATWTITSYILKVVLPWLGTREGKPRIAALTVLLLAVLIYFLGTALLSRPRAYVAIAMFAFVQLAADVALFVAGHSVAGWVGALSVLGLIAFEVFKLRRDVGTVESTDAPSEQQESRSFWRGFFDGYFVLFPAAVTMFAVRSWVFFNATPPEEPFVDNPIRGVNWLDGRITAVKVLGKNLLLLLFPKTLTADYSYNEVPVFSWDFSRFENWKPLFALAAIVALLGVAAWNFRRNKAVCFLILFFFLTILPTSNIPITIGAIMAERFLYVPLVAFVILLATTIDRLVRWILSGDEFGVANVGGLAEAGVSVTLLIGVGVYGVRSILRNQDWRDDEALWAAAYRTSPNSFRTYQSYAFSLYEKDAVANIDEILRVANEGKQLLDPLPRKLNSSRLYLHLGMYHNVKGETLLRRQPDGTVVITPEAAASFAEAVKSLEEASAIDRAFNKIYRERELRRGKLDPDKIPDAGLAPIYQYLTQSYIRVGDLNRAIGANLYWRHLDPSSIDAYSSLVDRYLATGRDDPALTTLLETILLGGNQPQYWPVLKTLFSRVAPDGNAAIGMDSNTGKYVLDVARTSVRETLVLAVRDLIRSFLRANQFERAHAWRDAAVNQYKVPAERVDSVFAEKLVPVEPPEPLFPLAPEQPNLPR